MEAGFIRGEPSTLNLHAAETTHVDGAIWFTAPRATPLLKLSHFARAIMDEMIDHILFAKPVTTGNGIVEVVIKRVVSLSNGC